MSEERERLRNHCTQKVMRRGKLYTYYIVYSYKPLCSNKERKVKKPETIVPRRMDRSWMYNMTNFGRMGLRPEFVEGVTDIIELHLYRNGFKREYTVWTSHGEIDNSFDVIQHYVPGESSSAVILMHKL
ncbi:hypothetical protein H5410_026644 [Solanum commersonii]|uniref:Uncharacterized protein n=1 Tax=Solanum commersonii TaxID=4109 RepID=A0A9J5YZF4_SOLCO|nr:hypothetical protein H5410_026644 [Solanum commersonii]